MSKLIEKMKSAERERERPERDRISRPGAASPQDSKEELVSKIEAEKIQEETALARSGDAQRGLDLARERQAAEAELRRLAHSRAEAEAKASRLMIERERAEAAAHTEARAREEAEKKAAAISEGRRQKEEEAAQHARGRAEAEAAAAAARAAAGE